MALSVYNTLTNSKERFKSIEENKVKMYLCGPTVYDYLHIGNFRGAITFNLVRNWLEHLGNEVTFVYNYTDVDDKIIARANELGIETSELTEKYIKAFEEDFARLGLKKHEYNPRVTEYMPQIIEFIEDLVKKEMAYEVEGEVFYSIPKFEAYGKLSKNNLDELQAGQRVEVDQKKQNPLDFVLWKPAKEGEPSWSSPWGEGRPGWHIECSAMSNSILGETIDIHGGGIDLIFPHHECEIAQSEGRTGKPYCNHWMHNNFINMGDEKMSKSLGNIVKGRDFMDQYSPEILKYLFLSAHYRSVLTISDDKILQTISALNRIYTAMELAKNTIAEVEGAGQTDAGFNKKLDSFDNKITKSLNDDFNTAEFIAHVFEAVRAFNALGFVNKKKKNAVHKGCSEAFLAWMHKYGQMSALFDQEPLSFMDSLEDILIDMKSINKEEVEKLVTARNAARDNKDWAKADEVRSDLEKIGVELFDGHQRGWKVKIND